MVHLKIIQLNQTKFRDFGWVQAVKVSEVYSQLCEFVGALTNPVLFLQSPHTEVKTTISWWP